jgi:hypothetical protein
MVVVRKFIIIWEWLFGSGSVWEEGEGITTINNKSSNVGKKRMVSRKKAYSHSCPFSLILFSSRFLLSFLRDRLPFLTITIPPFNFRS